MVSNELYKEESADLVIHSKEYINKTVFDDVPEERVEVKPEKKIKTMKLSKIIPEKSEQLDKVSEDDRSMNKSSK